VADLFEEENGMPEQECACSVELGAAHNDKNISLKSTAKHHHLRAAAGPAYRVLCKTSSLKECGTFFVARSKRNIPAENVRKWNIMNGMQVVSVAWKSIKTAL
jgi:hypothetical protein